MIIVGDIGNTETKICLVNSKNIIIKRVTLLTKKISHSLLKKSLVGLGLKDKSINKCLFCSVVPKSFNIIKSFLNKTYKIKCLELKNLKLNKFVKIKVNYKQIGSDRLANAIGIINNKDNFIILDFGTATTFDIIKNGVYEGGVIAPGVKLSMMNLSNSTALLPMFSLKNSQKNYGKNTKDALNAGFIWGYEGLINNIINKSICNFFTTKFYSKILSYFGFSS